MTQSADAFYDDMAAAYHLIFDDWDVAISRQQAVLCRLLPPPANAGIVLDCACGIGTQALGLVRAGYTVEGTDLSSVAIARARVEAAARNLNISLRVDDMRKLETSRSGRFGVVLAFDNSLPHLDSEDEVHTALGAMYDRLCPNGRLFISLRDYGPLMEQRPGMTAPAMFSDEGRRRIVHQVWDWQDERRYVVHLYITREMPNNEWITSHFLGRYRAITPKEIADYAAHVGFQQIKILPPIDTGYYQPVVMAVRP
jgi:glycine/sarcosine N-methyltransferase